MKSIDEEVAKSRGKWNSDILPKFSQGPRNNREMYVLRLAKAIHHYNRILDFDNDTQFHRDESIFQAQRLFNYMDCVD